MRIIGNIAHPVMKITVFKMDNKLSIKFEAGLYEQTYKFRESQATSSFQDLEKLVDEQFCHAVLAQFSVMHQMKNEVLGRAVKTVQGEDFEEII